jgi:hypothetical protein
VTGDPWTDAGLQDLHEALATLELLEDWLQRRPLPAMSPAEGERVSFAVQLARRSLRRGCGLAIAYDRGPIRGETPPEEGATSGRSCWLRSWGRSARRRPTR